MSLPTTLKQWSVQGTDKDFDGVQFQDGPVPKVGDNDVLVKMRGASLNYRDVLIPKVRPST
jgi:NADPH:quinone reductase-like Zn-dependent oxidoreductase